MVSRSIWTSWQNAARGEGHGLVQARDMRAYSMAAVVLWTHMPHPATVMRLCTADVRL